MTKVKEGDLLRSPTESEIENSRLKKFCAFVESVTGRQFEDYEALWKFSVDEVEHFWNFIWDFFRVIGSRPRELEVLSSQFGESQKRLVLSDKEMPGFKWFQGATCNYGANALSAPDDAVAAICYSETRPELRSYNFRELRDEVLAIQSALRQAGVVRGDRIAAYAPNIYETLAFFLAAASLGAIWSACSPDFGVSAVIDRFAQIEPKILFAVDGYRYGGKLISRLNEVSAIASELPSLTKTVVLDYVGVVNSSAKTDDLETYHSFISGVSRDGNIHFEPVDFSHPLWVLYSSGTTGLPKPIVQSHGGIVLEHLKAIGLHLDLGPNDRFFWFTTTGWMMWNFLIGGLLEGVPVVLFDGSPGYPDLGVLWRLSEEAEITYFGTSASFIQSCQKAGIEPAKQFDLSRLRGIGSTGSPLSPENFIWVYEEIGSNINLASVSGGTDMCTAFLGSSPWHECRAGELSARCLGAEIRAYDEGGARCVEEVGELVIETPMPSMPLGFWGDGDGSKFYDAYFSYFPGKWRHGDWVKVKSNGACVIYGRSDSTLNRGGIRMGTSDFYRVIESFDEVSDSLVIDTSHLGREGELLAFVVVSPGSSLNDKLLKEISRAIGRELSPRHVPDRIIEVGSIPRTMNGKKLEIPIKRILLGEDPQNVVTKGSLSDPNSLEFYVNFAKRLV